MEYNTLDILLWDKFNYLRSSTRLDANECLEALLNLIYKTKIRGTDYDILQTNEDSFKTSRILLNNSVENDITKSFIKNQNLFSSDSTGKEFGTFLKRILKGHLGSSYSPPDIGDFIAEIIQPKSNEKAIDPFCGSGNFLISLAHYGECKIYGNEINSLTRKIAVINFYFNRVYAKSLSQKDAENKLSEDNWYEYFDIVVAHPPFGSIRRSNSYEDLNYDLRKTYGSEFLPIYMERCLKLLKQGGKMALVLPESILKDKNYKLLRTYFETKAQIVFIVKIPGKVFMSLGTGVSACIVFFKKYNSNDARIDWEEGREKEIYKKLRRYYNYKVASGQFLLEEKEGNLNEEISNMDELVKKFKKFQKDFNIW